MHKILAQSCLDIPPSLIFDRNCILKRTSVLEKEESSSDSASSGEDEVNISEPEASSVEESPSPVKVLL